MHRAHTGEEHAPGRGDTLADAVGESAEDGRERDYEHGGGEQHEAGLRAETPSTISRKAAVSVVTPYIAA